MGLCGLKGVERTSPLPVSQVDPPMVWSSGMMARLHSVVAGGCARQGVFFACLVNVSLFLVRVFLCPKVPPPIPTKKRRLGYDVVD